MELSCSNVPWLQELSATANHLCTRYPEGGRRIDRLRYYRLLLVPPRRRAKEEWIVVVAQTRSTVDLGSRFALGSGPHSIGAILWGGLSRTDDHPPHFRQPPNGKMRSSAHALVATSDAKLQPIQTFGAGGQLNPSSVPFEEH